jgi:protoheme IX farnesyltransferase
LVLATTVNVLAAGLSMCGFVGYVGVYTIWLKRRTPQNIVIGGLSGALPPAIGWAAVTGTLSFAPVLLVAIIFMWTPPHFWSLALFRSDDYARAGVPMLPVVRGKPTTRRHIVAYALALVPLGLLPAAIGLGGPRYLVMAAGLGGLLLWNAFAVLRETDAAKEPAARRMFAVTIVYLFSLFAALIAEHLVGLAPLKVWM